MDAHRCVYGSFYWYLDGGHTGPPSSDLARHITVENHSGKELGPVDDYQDPSDLIVRQEIQEGFNTRPTDWSTWLFNQMRFPPRAYILEIGTGPGRLWAKNSSLLKSGWKIILSDSVFQMVSEARQNLVDFGLPFYYGVLDAITLPFNDAIFDGIIADGVLDVLPDLQPALSEISRTLKPGGCLIATAGGQTHLNELEEMVKSFARQAQYGRTSSQFTLENGLDILSTQFVGTRRKDYQDTLVFTKAEPILAYALSEGNMQKLLSGRRRKQFSRTVQNNLSSQGEIRVGIHKGFFETWKPLQR